MLVSDRTMPDGGGHWQAILGMSRRSENGRSRSLGLTPVSKTLEEFNNPFSSLLENSLLTYSCLVIVRRLNADEIWPTPTVWNLRALSGGILSTRQAKRPR
jgi:hypothetical protein